MVKHNGFDQFDYRLMNEKKNIQAWIITVIIITKMPVDCLTKVMVSNNHT